MRQYLGLGLISLLIACGSPTGSQNDQPQEGRDETQSIRNTESVGYSGNAIADKVDSALDAHEQRQQQLDAAEQN